MPEPPKEPSQEARRVLLLGSRWCAQQFGKTDPTRLNPCGGAFRAANTSEDGRRRLLCVILAQTAEPPGEISECTATYDQKGMSRSEAERQIAARYGQTTFENAVRTMKQPFNLDGMNISAEGILAEVDRLPALRAVAAGKAYRVVGSAIAPVAEVQKAPLKVEERPADIGARIREVIAAPPKTLLEVTSFPVAIGECLRDEPALLENVVRVATDIDDRLREASDSAKLRELCHQVVDAARVEASVTAHDLLEDFARCLRCPPSSSLVQLVLPHAVGG